jgi:hypothetical protein
MSEFHVPAPFDPFDLTAIGSVLAVVLLVLGIRKLWSALK